MVTIDDFDDELVRQVRRATTDFIQSAERKWEGDLPTKKVYVPGEDRILEEEIGWPSPILRIYSDERSDTLRPAAEWIEENPRKSYTWEELVGEPLSDEQPGLKDVVLEPKREQLIDSFEEDLLELTEEIVNYTGQLEWDEDVFREVTTNFLIDVEAQGPSEPATKEFNVIYPLVDFELMGDPIELDPNVEIVDRFDGEWISAAEISELTPAEIATIYTHKGRRKIGKKQFGDATHGIKLTVHGSSYASNDDQLRDAVVTALRLFKPSDATPHADEGYRLERGALHHRRGLLDVVAGTKPMSTPGVPYFGDTYGLSRIEGEMFTDFWEAYMSKLNPRSDTSVGRPLRRFNYVHQRSSLEDQLVDCAIALEGTLLRDVNPGSSLTFRLMLRSGLLLDRDMQLPREQIREIFRAVYVARGDIVHSDDEMEEIISREDKFELFNGRKPAPREFVDLVQVLLAKVLLRYIIEAVENDNSITEVNQEMDEAGLNATYP